MKIYGQDRLISLSRHCFSRRSNCLTSLWRYVRENRLCPNASAIMLPAAALLPSRYAVSSAATTFGCTRSHFSSTVNRISISLARGILSSPTRPPRIS